MNLVEYLRFERRRARDCAARIEAELGPQTDLGFNDCAAIDGKRVDHELAALGELVKRVEEIEREFAWPLLRSRPEASRSADDIALDEKRLEEWVSLIRSILAAGDCIHVHSLRSGLRSLIRELDHSIEQFDAEAAPLLRSSATGVALEELGRRAERG